MKHIKGFNEGFGNLFKSKKRKLREKHFGVQDLSRKDATSIEGPENVVIEFTSEPNGEYKLTQNTIRKSWGVHDGKQSPRRHPYAVVRETDAGDLILTLYTLKNKGKKIKVPSIQKALNYMEELKQNEIDTKKINDDTWDEEIY